MIKDLRTANLNKDKELKTIFPKSFDFICNTMGYKIEDFNLLLQKKCIQVNSIFIYPSNNLFVIRALHKFLLIKIG